MSFSIGIDIGGTKIAGAIFGDGKHPLAQQIAPTPNNYSDLLAACGAMIQQFDKNCGEKASLGIGIAGAIDQQKGIVFAPNIPCLENQSFRTDCKKTFGRPVPMANDADCAALAEALEGAGQGYRAVFGLIMGTGVGGGLIINQKIYQGPHGLVGEIGHLPLPMRDAADGPVAECGCGQKGCIDKSISGPALARLYHAMTGKDVGNEKVTDVLERDGAGAHAVLDQFYTTVAKAMVAIIHAYDPEIIVVNGGLNILAGMYEEVPKRWVRYALNKNLKTKFVPAKLGALSGVRGAALLQG